MEGIMERNFYRTRVRLLVFGTVGLLFAGIIYAWSILKLPLENEFGWSNSQTATSYTITISLFCLGCIAGGLLIRTVGPKVPVLIGAVLIGAGFFLTSTLDGHSVVRLYLYYGVMAGFGIGMAYNTILAVVGAWFPDKKGFSTGVLMMGFGASTLVFGNLARTLIDAPTFGWRMVFICLAACAAASLAVVGAMIRMPTAEDLTVIKDSIKTRVTGEAQETVKTREGETETPAAAGAGQKEDFLAEDLSSMQMIQRPSFWRFFVAMLLLGSAGSSLISFARDFSVSVGATAALAGLYVGILSVANGLGRILTGMIYDRFGRKIVLIFVSLLEIAACLVCVGASASGSLLICLVGFILVGLSYGGNSNAIAVFITDFYGTKYYAQNLSFGLMTLLPSALLAKFSTTLLNVSGGYVVPFVVLAVYGAVSLFLHMINKRP